MQIEEPNTSRNIPLPIQREVRQRCGFGCVVCGIPLYAYHHMEEWSVVRRHVAAEITLLCDQHHRELHGGLLPIEQIRTANADPYNLRHGVSKPYDLHFSGTSAEVAIGGNTFRANGAGDLKELIPVIIDDVPLVRFALEDDHLLFNLLSFDECNELVLEIRDNELLYSVRQWDIQLIGTRLIVRESPRHVLLDIAFNPPDHVRINGGRILFNGVEVLISEDKVVVTNTGHEIYGNRTTGVKVGLALGRQSIPFRSMYSEKGIPRVPAIASKGGPIAAS